MTAISKTAVVAPLPAGLAAKHRSAGVTGEGVTASMATFIAHLRGSEFGNSAVIRTGAWKQAAASVTTSATPDRVRKHQPG